MLKVVMTDNIFWNNLPVIKIVKYPKEQKALKIFAQSKICYQNTVGFNIRIWSFETTPLAIVYDNRLLEIFKDSVVSCVFDFYPEEFNKKLMLTFNKNGNYVFQLKENEDISVIEDEVKVKVFTGEDLQGVYWGIEFIIFNDIIKKYYGKSDFMNNSTINVNFIKSCFDDDFLHYGGVCEVQKDNFWNQLQPFKMMEY